MSKSIAILRLALALALCGSLSKMAMAAKKTIVLEPITYNAGVDRQEFEGIDRLLFNRLVRANKYEVVDRDASRATSWVDGRGVKPGLALADYLVRCEIVRMHRTGKSRKVAGALATEYVATVSLRVYDLRTQNIGLVDTLCIAGYCLSPKDMLDNAVKRMALAIMRCDYPLQVIGNGDDGMLTLNYGADFVCKGERYEVHRRVKMFDRDPDCDLYKERIVGICEVTDAGCDTSMAKLVEGSARGGDTLR